MIKKFGKSCVGRKRDRIRETSRRQKNKKGLWDWRLDTGEEKNRLKSGLKELSARGAGNSPRKNIFRCLAWKATE